MFMSVSSFLIQSKSFLATSMCYIAMPPYLSKAPVKTSEVMAINLIKMLIEGPLVSFKGSPTVSPMTAAL